MNLSRKYCGRAGIGKYYGTAEKAENLVVSANELPVAASKFLRSDKTSTANESLIISNDKGLRIGVTNTIDIAVSNGTGQMVNNTRCSFRF